jgi:peptide/nickel transport system ATP-binding protein
VIEGRDLATIPPTDLITWRGGTAGFCFQEASSALNPVYTTGFQLEETIRCHRAVGRSEARELARGLLEMVAVEPVEQILDTYPHQLSGGQAQRVMLALALAGEPRLLIADEPTSAIDAITRVEILTLLDRLVGELGLALLLISHDLEVVRDVVDRVAVMYAGEIVEEAPTDVLFGEPLHPYTQLLLASSPEGPRRATCRGRPEGPDRGPTDAQACAFTPRCPLARDTCRSARPDLVGITEDRRLRCPVAADTHQGERVRP